MATRRYRIVVAATKAGLEVAAGRGWTILSSTLREFRELDTNDDQSLGDIGAVTVEGHGWIALAYIDP